MEKQQHISPQLVINAFEENYENRSPEQHAIAIELMMQVMPELNKQEAKVMSLFVVLVPANNPEAKQNFTINSTVVQFVDNQFILSKLQSQDQIDRLNLEYLTLYLAEKHFNSIRNIKTVDEQIKFLQGNKYCKEMFRKSLHILMKNVQYVNYRFGWTVYAEGQDSSSGKGDVFMVRTGDFCFKKNIDHQPSMLLYQFGPGTIFGNEDGTGFRQFSVSCRSSRGVLLRFSQDFFNNFMKKQCEMLLQINRIKMDEFLSNRMRETQENRFKNQGLMGQTFRRTANQQSMLLTAPMLSTTLTTSRNSQTTCSLPKLSTFDKLPSLTPKPEPKQTPKTQFIKMTNSELQQQAQIINKQIKYNRLRQIVCRKEVPPRGQILMSLVKQSWKNEKTKQKKIIW